MIIYIEEHIIVNAGWKHLWIILSITIHWPDTFKSVLDERGKWNIQAGFSFGVIFQSACVLLPTKAMKLLFVLVFVIRGCLNRGEEKKVSAISCQNKYTMICINITAAAALQPHQCELLFWSENTKQVCAQQKPCTWWKWLH